MVCILNVKSLYLCSGWHFLMVDVDLLKTAFDLPVVVKVFFFTKERILLSCLAWTSRTLGVAELVSVLFLFMNIPNYLVISNVSAISLIFFLMDSFHLQ